jgi:hypothetical protein
MDPLPIASPVSGYSRIGLEINWKWPLIIRVPPDAHHDSSRCLEQ